MKSPVTIVIPAYNRESTLPRTLDSVAAQRVSPARVVLVDNNSTDSTLACMCAWAEAHPELDVRVVTESKPGACAARNRGLHEVETDFVMFFDSDDVMLPAHVGDFSEAIRSHPAMDIFGRSIILEGLDGNRRTLYYTASSPLFNHIFRGCLSTQRMVVRTELVREVGGWAEDLPGWNDYELGVRLLLVTDKVHELPGEPTVITYRLGESITGTAFSAKPQVWERSLDRIEKHFRAAGRTEMIPLVDGRRMILAAQYAAESTPNASRESTRLRKAVLDRTVMPLRMRLIYAHNRIFHRLTWLLVRMMIRVK